MNNPNTIVTFTVDTMAMGKQRAQTGRGGHHFTPPPTRAFEGFVATMARAAVAGRKPYEGAVELQLTSVFQIPISWSKVKKQLAKENQIHPIVCPDLSNIIKAIEDGMNKIVYNDDKQICRHNCQKIYGESPSFTVTVNKI
jgi:Holliday junction resolvase RusA-like endonuclease